MKKIWEDDFNNLYRDVEDMQNHCKYLESENNQLQSNWNSLREWLEDNPNVALNGDGKDFVIYIELQKVLDKMNELEGVDNEKI